MSPDLPEGRIYVLHSSATGPCPSLDWHIVVERNDVLARMVAWDNMRSMDRSTGRVLVAQISFFLVIILSAVATGCLTMKPDCEGVWTLPPMCFLSFVGESITSTGRRRTSAFDKVRQNRSKLGRETQSRTGQMMRQFLRIGSSPLSALIRGSRRH